jgi:hypothetical protein
LVDNRSHLKLVIEELLPQAQRFVEEGERRLAAQEARVTNLERKGRDIPQSKKLLTIMRETMALQISHLKLLQREVRSEQDDQAITVRIEATSQSLTTPHGWHVIQRL